MKKISCDICGNVFADRSGLRKHKQKKKKCVIPENITKNVSALSLESLHEKIDNLCSTTSTINNIYNNNNNLNQNQKFVIQLAPNDKQQINHISDQEMLHILNKKFPDSFCDLTNAMYFNPRAPENISWCVADIKDKYGALEYNEETQTIVRRETKTVIEKKLSLMLYSLNDKLMSLGEITPLNNQQQINQIKLCSMVGTIEFHSDDINIIKQSVYEHRDFAKALWKRININAEKIIFK